MALKNLFDMAKADKYTQDGREALIKAQEAETEDKVYQIGEISQKTGLQKTANGWVKPKSGKQPGAKKEESKAAPKSLAGTPMKKADLNSKDPYEITHSMKPDTASEAKEMDKISAFMQEETGATLRNAITARESFYKNTKNPTPEQQEGLAALMKIQQKLGYGKPAEGPALNGQKKTVSHQEYRDGPMYGPAESKPAAGNNLKWNEMPNGRVWTSKTPGGKPLTVTWNREKNGDVWYGRSDSDIKYKSKEEAMNAPVAKEKKRLTWSPNASVSEKFNDIIKLGAKSEDRTKRPGGYIGPKVQENYIRKALSKRLGATEESIDDLLEGMDDITRKNAFNGFMENYSEDAAPRVLTGDCRIRIRKEKPALTGDTKIRVRK